MKKRLVWLLLIIGMSVGSAATAAPERIALKTADQQAKERVAEAQIKSIDLEDIEDPVAKRAIMELFNYLGLQAKK